MKKLLITASLIGVTFTLPVDAATQTGNLNVSTTIEVSCAVPSPSGTLSLPFDSSSALDSQALASTPVTVTVECMGNPTVSHVDFDDGNNLNSSGVRFMQRDGSSGMLTTDILGYKLWARAGTGHTSAQIEDNGTPILDDTNNNNRLLIDSVDGNFMVTGKVYEDVERTNAYGDPSSAASGSKVIGGDYRDEVYMTVNYN